MNRGKIVLINGKAVILPVGSAGPEKKLKGPARKSSKVQRKSSKIHLGEENANA